MPTKKIRPIKDSKKRFKKNRMNHLFSNNILSRDIHLDFNSVAENIKRKFRIELKNELEGICTIEGYIKRIYYKCINIFKWCFIENMFPLK